METAALLKSRAVPTVFERGVSDGKYVKPFERLLDITPQAVKPLVKVVGDQVGQGYGIPTEEGLEAISLMARNEGILIDPVYTGKALAGLINNVRENAHKPGQTVVFLHTGGVPADFAYREVLTEGRNAR
jgi:1-aminocyclopropane-1-carboxylate deaminase/D-cysteine desulfhydrase-like pyridoxal-dependent ACC family enzyme